MSNNSIYTIPINEVFEPKTGCPFCRLKDMLEKRCLDYILGAAMMEPDIRQETNRLGFCARHLDMMLRQRNRLALALMLQTHLDEIKKEAFGSSILPVSAEKREKRCAKMLDSCYVCEKIDKAYEKIVLNTLDMYAKQTDFRALFAQQEGLCLGHYRQLLELAPAHMGKKEKEAFLKQCAQLCEQSLEKLRADVAHYTKMSDYRNAGGDWGDAKDAIERTIGYLSSRIPE